MNNKLIKIPDYTWEWCFCGDWDSIVVKIVKPPCLFYRLMQRWILDIHWREIKA